MRKESIQITFSEHSEYGGQVLVWTWKTHFKDFPISIRHFRRASLSLSLSPYTLNMQFVWYIHNYCWRWQRWWCVASSSAATTLHNAHNFNSSNQSWMWHEFSECIWIPSNCDADIIYLCVSEGFEKRQTSILINPRELHEFSRSQKSWNKTIWHIVLSDNSRLASAQCWIQK